MANRYTRSAAVDVKLVSDSKDGSVPRVTRAFAALVSSGTGPAFATQWKPIEAAGAAGATGATGQAGTAGAAGAVGATGSLGTNGAAGANGATGAAGSAGAAGTIGATGNTGPAGAAGAVGATGVAGAAGSAGGVGATGQAGAAGAAGASGATGALGTPGNVRYRWGCDDHGNIMGDRYCNVTMTGTISASEIDSYYLVQQTATLSAMRVILNNPYAINTVVITLRVNSVDTSITVTINPGNTSASISGQSVSVTVNDKVSIKYNSNLTESNATLGMRLVVG